MMRVGSFCSGIGAPEVAWRRLGWSPAYFAEIEPFPSAVLAHHFPGVPNLGDVTKILPRAGDLEMTYLRSVDVLVAGTPCQAFSVAGLRGSLSDDRGNLSLVFCELVHAIDPFCVVWENVPGVLSTSDNAFGCFLAGLVGEGQPLVSGYGHWADAGVAVGPRRSAAWRVLDAQHFGLAQRRRRVFVVSFRAGDGLNPGAVLFEPESLPRDSPSRREAGAGVAEGASVGAGDRGCGVDTYNAALDGDVAHTMPSNAGPGRDPHVMEPIPIQADAFGRSGDASDGVKHPGLGVAVPGAPMFTLDASQAHAIAFSFSSTGGAGGAVEDGGTCQTLGVDMGAPAIAFDAAQITANVNRTRAEPGLPCSTIGETSRMHVAQPERMIVRRLTPRECERLQGFPDRWTDVLYRGKSAADGPRYRALGNAMAVNVLEWIGRRIERVLACRRNAAG